MVAHDNADALAAQVELWDRQTFTIPDLKCRKSRILPTLEMALAALRDGERHDLSGEVADPDDDVPLVVWRHIAGALQFLGLATVDTGWIMAAGGETPGSRSDLQQHVADALGARSRLFTESVALVGNGVTTVDEVNERLVTSFDLPWKSAGQIRSRLTWAEILELIEWSDARTLRITERGRAFVEERMIVTPEAVAHQIERSYRLPEAPPEIARLIDDLAADPSHHDDRRTYNLWIPSPTTRPSKIDNLAYSIGLAREELDKETLLGRIAETFGLRLSSVNSMLPFMRGVGLLTETRKGVFAATPEALAWLDSGERIDLIRLLHCRLRFVGEILRESAEPARRSEIGRAAERYGMNKEKSRWIMALLIEADLLMETSYSTVRTTSLGMEFISTIPLQPIPSAVPVPTVEEQNLPEGPDEADQVETLASRLERAGHDPMAEGLGSGEAFERAVADAFVLMGFVARRIGGSGDSDVLVRWRDTTGQEQIASIDAKSTSANSIDHTHVSDVALASHAAKNGAEHIAIVAPGFAGKTLPEMARSRHWTLITVDDLVELLRATRNLGLKPSEVARVFDGEDGLDTVHAVVEERRRQLGIVSLIVKRLRTESENDEALSPRDISLMERDSRIAPRIPELVTAMDLLSKEPISSIERVQDASEPKHVSFTIGDALASAMRLRALADAIESGWQSA